MLTLLGPLSLPSNDFLPVSTTGTARTSHTRTVASELPETRTVDSALNESEWIEEVWPVIDLILRPEPRSQRLIVKSSAARMGQARLAGGRERNVPALARYRPSGDMAIVETAPRWPTKTRTQVPFWTSQSRQVRSLDPVAR